ncbi:serologically defined colon cancer antigen 8 isoform X2 [Tympanuchus pallidicinctus]|uniref:serologically defined colon cancer antigen 8 isoform X2 n=1 Tax=Tympanuchus pallidicinctus TaxID=109042 RepID=UPI002287543E|nr:serologically defined colon cancer antigen 8 isoform X2 [Tympanuchus pallidicinctus]
MRAPRGQPALEESLQRYQRRLRERANESIHQLKYALEERHFTENKDKVGFDQSSVDKGSDDVDRCSDNSGDPPWEELQHSHAVNQLKILLQHQEKMESEASPSRRKMQFRKTPKAATEDLPDPSDLIPRINDQSQYINHLEAEVKFYKEELSEMKDQVRVVILENENLHQKLKFLAAEYTSGEQAFLDTSNSRHNDLKLHQPSMSSSAYNRDPALVSKTVGEVEKWHVELEKLKLLYQDKINILDAQVQSLRKHLSESQKTCEDLEARLKHQKSLVSATNSSRVGGLCLKCAQQEAILAQTHSNVHMQAIERVTKERDDLMDALVSVRRNMKEMQQRESNAYEQVKQAVQMTEEANLEKTKALVQCEQLKSEMERQKNRLEKELAVQLNKRTEEKEALREEMKKERENLAAMVTAMSENVAMLEAQVERITREKNSLVNQLEESQHQLASHEMEMNKVCGEMRYQLNQTKMKKDEAEKELREYRTKTIRQLEIKDQKIEKLGLELNGNKQRLEQAQQDVAGAREDCLKLTELLSKSEHQLHLTRSKVNQLSQEKEYLHGRLEKVQKRNDELDQQCIQHGRMHERMKSRLHQLDKHCQATAQQLVELLNKQNQLFKEKQLLTEEVQFLRTQEKKWDADLKQDTDGIK